MFNASNEEIQKKELMYLLDYYWAVQQVFVLDLDLQEFFEPMTGNPAETSQMDETSVLLDILSYYSNLEDEQPDEWNDILKEFSEIKSIKGSHGKPLSRAIIDAMHFPNTCLDTLLNYLDRNSD